jgi:hypothetical protein
MDPWKSLRHMKKARFIERYLYLSLTLKKKFYFNGELLANITRLVFGLIHVVVIHIRGKTQMKQAKRRLQEEMGMSSELTFLFKFQYKCDFENGLIEHELDHVFIGKTDDTPHLNTDEAMAFKWMSIENLEQDMLSYPENYTFWFKLIIEQYRNKFTPYF